MRMLKAFCMPGGHSVDVPGDDPNKVPDGWTFEPADVIPTPILAGDQPWSPGIWFYSPDSPYKVLCCPDHPLVDPRSAS